MAGKFGNPKNLYKLASHIVHDYIKKLESDSNLIGSIAMRQDLLPALLMVLVQIEFAGMNIFSKLAMDSGMNPYIHVAYRQIFASLVIVPLAYFIERGERPPMTTPILIQIFFCSFFGLALNPITYFVGLKNTTPTIGCALSNLLPGLTFILAVAFKQENVKLKTLGGQAKLIGTLLGVGGAMVLALYHGPLVPIRGSSIHLNIVANDYSDHTQGNILGPILVIISALTWSIWFIIQARMGNKYPAPYSIAALMLLMGTVQCCVFGVIMEPRLSEWSLYPGIRALASIYAGVACSGIGVCIMSWCIDRKGALFISVFSPLLLVIVAALSWTFLREKLYLGTVLGSVLIVIGLYIVLWGKSKEIQCQPELQEAKKDIEMH
ncbi:WAT1-related protein At1g09380-like [Bidens hawaiensis]|uniref:WAT1-related protein At1g09380-like n=1 Tax=Bidens hawaiensis TaxID=980011 RepID=UPI00404B45D9